MSTDDDNRFRPRPGRVRSDAPKAGRQAKSFLSKVRKITRQQQAAAVPSTVEVALTLIMNGWPGAH